MKMFKDKDKLTSYRRLIEQRMEQFKDIERENKTKPHSKQGLNAEEKMDPHEKEKCDVVEWIQTQIRGLTDESDRTEMQLESISNADQGKKRGKKDDGKKGEKEKRMEELKKHLERMKFHIGKLEVCMRMVNNESLEPRRVIDVLKEPMEMYIEAIEAAARGDDEDEPDNYDPEDAYEELNLATLCAQIGAINIGSMDEEHKENGHDNGLSSTPSLDDDSKQVGGGSRHASSDGPISPAPRRTIVAASVPTAQPQPPHQQPPLQHKLSKEDSTDSSSAGATGGASGAGHSGGTSHSSATPPPSSGPPGIPYNSVAAGRTAASIVAGGSGGSSSGSASVGPIGPTPAPVSASSAPQQPAAASVLTAQQGSGTNAAPQQQQQGTTSIAQVVKGANKPTANSNSTPTTANLLNDENRVPSSNVQAELAGNPMVAELSQQQASAAQQQQGQQKQGEINQPQQQNQADMANGGMQTNIINAEDQGMRVLRMAQANTPPVSNKPQRATIPAWLGASPLGRMPMTSEYESQLNALELALTRTPLPMDSERPRTYLPKIPCPCSPYYPQTPPANSDTLEYYLRLSPETLFFIFYYMEGTRAQLLAAKALKKLSWRFHTKYLTWFQRHEEPKHITDDYEQGTYVYFDFEKWSQRKKEAFTFEYRYLEDKDFE
ncbi:hypothetical protein WR25_04094 isoform A [Diploscapter pachys]|uniref:NOT2/NOT3/NOT5 C-terminal domain-containing protein n=2 Tax=Diploscapter pachys TaxID=2018661 RepID=A0A2A2J298_9BILA|nr:hypothetical protein WR25_04094 isoform A [Diploscapter pachys]